MAQLNFDATQVAPNSGSPDPVPAGWYNVMIDESEMKPTKDGAGSYLQLRFNILDGQYANRKIFDRLNLRNANATAQEIAYGNLSAICHAVGLMQVTDSQELHGKPLKIKVALRPAKDGFDASNDVKGYKNINEQTGDATLGETSQPVQQGFQQPPQQQPQQAAPQQQQAAQQQQQPWQQPPQQPWQQPAQGQAAPTQQQAPQEQQQEQQQQQPAPAGMPPWATGQSQN